ncbi:MAG TPA: LysE family transporter [Gammaproteobacteria bacterium]|jgi:threonine/homoserine/homoserine lactone efflux protein|nr:LysE family transporter [Gammaproteobacteria bacterium]
MIGITQATGWHAALAGGLLGLSLAAPPGPVMAIMATAALRGRVREALMTAFGAICADFTWLSLAILGAVTILDRHPRGVGLMGLAGAALLLWMAWGAWKAARAGIHGNDTPGSWKLGYMTVLTSPFSLAWWLANGTLLYTSWGAPGILGLFLSLFLYTVAFTYAFRWLGARAARAAVGVAYGSVLMLVGFGLYVGWESLKLLG